MLKLEFVQDVIIYTGDVYVMYNILDGSGMSQRQFM